MNKEFLKMQKLAGLITESQYKQLTEFKQGDKVGKEYVLASSDDNDIADGEFEALLVLCKDANATKDNFLVTSETKPDYDVSYSGKQLIYLINRGAAKIICQDQVNEVITSYRTGDDIFDVINIDIIQPDEDDIKKDDNYLDDEPGIDGYAGGVGFPTGRQKDGKYTEEQKENYLKYLKEKADEGNEKAIELLKIAKTLPEVQPFLK